LSLRKKFFCKRFVIFKSIKYHVKNTVFCPKKLEKLMRIYVFAIVNFLFFENCLIFGDPWESVKEILLFVHFSTFGFFVLPLRNQLKIFWFTFLGSLSLVLFCIDKMLHILINLEIFSNFIKNFVLRNVEWFIFPTIKGFSLHLIPKISLFLSTWSNFCTFPFFWFSRCQILSGFGSFHFVIRFFVAVVDRIRNHHPIWFVMEGFHRRIITPRSGLLMRSFANSMTRFGFFCRSIFFVGWVHSWNIELFLHLDWIFKKLSCFTQDFIVAKKQHFPKRSKNNFELTSCYSWDLSYRT